MRCAINVRELVSVRHGHGSLLISVVQTTRRRRGEFTDPSRASRMHRWTMRDASTTDAWIQYWGRPHDFGDCGTTSMNAIRRVHDRSTTKQSQSGRGKNWTCLTGGAGRVSWEDFVKWILSCWHFHVEKWSNFPYIYDMFPKWIHLYTENSSFVWCLHCLYRYSKTSNAFSPLCSF